MTNAVSKIEQPDERHNVITATTPADLLAMAVNRGADLDQLQKFMELKDRWDANEARKAFHEALTAFKADPPSVTRDKVNKQYDSRYTSLANLVNTVNASLSPHGLSARWDIGQQDQIQVTCILSHVLGHSERVTIKGPPDKSGAKNDLHQIKSTITYLKGATFEAVTGIATDEFNADDDGNSAAHLAETEAKDSEKYADWLTAINDASSLDELQTVWKGMPPAVRICTVVKRAKDRRKAELS